MSPSSGETRVLLAGVARVVITPPIGIRMLGYTVQEACSQDVERDLTATVLVLSDGSTTVVIAALDVVFVPLVHADRIRAAIGQHLGIPAENVLLNGSHTHLGPMFPGWQEEESPQKNCRPAMSIIWRLCSPGQQQRPGRNGGPPGLAAAVGRRRWG